MSFRRFVSFLPATVLLAGGLAAQAPLARITRPTRISAGALPSDVAILRRAFETLHPGLYRYAPRAAVDDRFDALARALDGARTLEETFVAISRFLATVRCGHTWANFVNQSDAVAAELFDRHDRLPFLFEWIDRRMVVTRDLGSGAALAPGTVVLTVDGVPTDRILDTLLTIARADGGNDAKRIRQLEVRGEGRWEPFDVYFRMFFPTTDTLIRLRIRSPRGPERTVAVAAAGPERPRTDARRWTLTYQPVGGDADPAADSLAVLRMPTWALYDETWDWKGWLDSAFTELERRAVPNLVIDLRGNEGGLGVGDEILHHLARRELRTAQLRRWVRYRTVPADLRPYLDTWDRSFDDWGAAAKEAPGRPGFYRLTRWDDDTTGATVIPPAPHPYDGRVWVLVDAAVSSATFEFAAAARALGVATLVGRPTGGNRRGINGGAFYFLRLPGSGIEVDLPLVGFFPDAPQPDAGLLPDVRVPRRVRDVVMGGDPDLDAVRAKIRRRW